MTELHLRLRGAYNIDDLRELARRRLPKGLFEFVDRAAVIADAGIKPE